MRTLITTLMGTLQAFPAMVMSLVWLPNCFQRVLLEAEVKSWLEEALRTLLNSEAAQTVKGQTRSIVEMVEVATSSPVRTLERECDSSAVIEQLQSN